MAPSDELGEEELGTVAGGAGTDGLQSSSLRVTLQSTRQRETTKTDFGTVLGSGLEKSVDLGNDVAAPFVPGGSVLSAAVSGVSSLGDESDR